MANCFRCDKQVKDVLMWWNPLDDPPIAYTRIVHVDDTHCQADLDQVTWLARDEKDNPSWPLAEKLAELRVALKREGQPPAEIRYPTKINN